VRRKKQIERKNCDCAINISQWRWRKLKNKGAMYSTRKRRNEKNIYFSAVGTYLRDRLFATIHYEKLYKKLKMQCMH